MLFCGSPPYPGSAYLAGVAAARVGGGLITLAVTDNMLPIYASSFHEATFVILPAEETESFERALTLTNHLQNYRALADRPGTGTIFQYPRSHTASSRAPTLTART